LNRPAIANERLRRNRAGQVVLQLKSAYQDGTTHIVMAPLEFMQRLAALVPRPRLHLIRFHGVLAPNAKLRAQIIPGGSDNVNEKPTDHAEAARTSTPARMSWARLLKRVFDIGYRTLPTLWGPLEDHRRHRRARRDRQNPHASGPAHPGTAPISARRLDLSK
jgi:hypothetical protein